MLSHMDDGHQTSPDPKNATQPTPTPQPPVSDAAPSPKAVVPVSPAAAEYDEQLKKDKQTLRRLGIVAAVIAIIMVVIFVGLIFAVSGAYTAKNANGKSSGGSNTTSGSLVPTEKNPAATGNASASAEGNYCSNAINATLSC